MLSIRHRVVKMEDQAQQREEGSDSIFGGGWRFFMRGENEETKPQKDQFDFRVEKVRQEKLKPYDQFMRKFQYKKALDAALEVCIHSSIPFDTHTTDKGYCGHCQHFARVSAEKSIVHPREWS